MRHGYLHESQDARCILVVHPGGPPVVLLEALLLGRVVNPQQSSFGRATRCHQVEKSDRVWSPRLGQVLLSVRVLHQVGGALVR